MKRIFLTLGLLLLAVTGRAGETYDFSDLKNEKDKAKLSYATALKSFVNKDCFAAKDTLIKGNDETFIKLIDNFSAKEKLEKEIGGEVSAKKDTVRPEVIAGIFIIKYAAKQEIDLEKERLSRNISSTGKTINQTELNEIKSKISSMELAIKILDTTSYGIVKAMLNGKVVDKDSAVVYISKINKGALSKFTDEYRNKIEDAERYREDRQKREERERIKKERAESKKKVSLSPESQPSSGGGTAAPPTGTNNLSILHKELAEYKGRLAAANDTIKKLHDENIELATNLNSEKAKTAEAEKKADSAVNPWWKKSPASYILIGFGLIMSALAIRGMVK
jgi:hypothetical protein